MRSRAQDIGASQEIPDQTVEVGQCKMRSRIVVLDVLCASDESSSQGP